MTKPENPDQPVVIATESDLINQAISGSPRTARKLNNKFLEVILRIKSLVACSSRSNLSSPDSTEVNCKTLNHQLRMLSTKLSYQPELGYGPRHMALISMPMGLIKKISGSPKVFNVY